MRWASSAATPNCVEFAAAVDTAAAGSGVVLSISGEPGIGKSRLAKEGLALARERGCRTLQAPPGATESDLTLAPILQAFRPLIDGTVEDRADDLFDGLADLGLLFEGLPTPRLEAAADVGLARSRAFESVCRLVQRLAAERPVVMLVEDLHWADPTTLDLVGYLALALGDHRALIVTTDRGDAADEALRRFRAPLRRVDRLVDLRLSALAPDDVAELVRASLGGDPPAPLLDLLAARASGIPLYVTAFVAALREQGRLARSGDRWVLRPGDDTALPSSVVDVVAVRLDELPGADVDLLAAVAVCGDAATADMLCASAISPTFPRDWTPWRAPGRLVDERSDGAVPVYRPHHPLVADVAYRRLSSGERRQRQAAAASYLVENDIADRRRTAHHVRLAGPAFDPEQALDILAADSTDVGDDDLPAAQAMVALARAAGRSDLVATGLRRVAEAATLAGDVPTAITAWQDAADAAEDPIGGAGPCGGSPSCSSRAATRSGPNARLTTPSRPYHPAPRPSSASRSSSSA